MWTNAWLSMNVSMLLFPIQIRQLSAKVKKSKTHIGGEVLTEQWPKREQWVDEEEWWVVVVVVVLLSFLPQIGSEE